MNVDRLYFPVETLGPGQRMVLWTAGCSKQCPGCSNPELWDACPKHSIGVHNLASAMLDAAESHGCRRLTVTGGDPLEQPKELLELLKLIRSAFDDILVYTGYVEDEIEGNIGSGLWRQIRSRIDALIDGPYLEELNDGACALRGSANQRLVVYSKNLENDYVEVIRQPRRVQNVVYDGRSLSIGIHGRP